MNDAVRNFFDDEYRSVFLLKKKKKISIKTLIKPLSSIDDKEDDEALLWKKRKQKPKEWTRRYKKKFHYTDRENIVRNGWICYCSSERCNEIREQRAVTFPAGFQQGGKEKLKKGGGGYVGLQTLIITEMEKR